MRLLILMAGIGCILAAAPAVGQAPYPTSPFELSAAARDTTTRIRFDIRARPLTEALGEFSRQAGVRVEVDAAAAAGERSQPVSGTYTSGQALRLLLVGTRLEARFADGEIVRVTRAAGDGDTTVYRLTPVTVTAGATAGYAASRSTTATRTDTPLRDAPQSVSVVSRDVIDDQAMQGIADVARYVPGITMGQGEGHRDAPTIRGNSSTADFFVDGLRDDAQYFRDLYNVERVEALKGPNAMIFGRGGGGGVLNRVSKEAEWAPTRAFTGQGGSFGHRRATVDLGQALGAGAAARVNGMYEESGGFRDGAELKRYGLNPTVALALGARTTVRAGYEYFNDDRTVDRGIPSFQGRPSDANITTFFGNPDASFATMRIQAVTAGIDHAAGGLTIRNRTRFADYDKFYQNSYPGGLNAEGTQVTLSAYSQSTGRRNLLNQTDLVYGVATGAVRHTLLLGAEVGRQETENYRLTGYYNDATASVSVPFVQPTVATPIIFRQSTTDADNRTTASVAGVYLQDQVELSRVVKAIVGLRWDRFAIDFRNERNEEELSRTDDLLSPRAGLVLKPAHALSLYGSYSVSFLPSSGDQFGSLSATSRTLKPERFTSYEAGVKWDLRPDLALTSAVYRLDRTNTTAPDPTDATRIVQTGSERTTGLELGATGNVTSAWQVIAGFAAQRARITSTTTAAPEGNTVPLVPERTFSLWNRIQLIRPLGVGIGVVHQSDMYAAVDNTVTLPGFTRVDGAVFVRIAPVLSAQVNVENLFDQRYYATSHGNNNIMPGASRTVRVSLSTRR